MPFFPQSKEYLLSTIIFLYQEYFYESISRHQSHIQRPTKRERSTSLLKKSNSSSISFHLNSITFPRIISTNQYRDQSYPFSILVSPRVTRYTRKHTHDLTDPMVHDPSICIKRGHTRFQEYRGKIPFYGEMHRVVANNAGGNACTGAPVRPGST